LCNYSKLRERNGQESREFIQDTFASRKFRVEEACDGTEALRKIKEIEPDLVLMDIRMPVMDGYAVLRQLREDPRFSKLPVVALTAFAMEGDRRKALAAGFDGYISKPVSPAALRSQIEQLLES
jgi:CheY-like chemotaxis protein